MSTSTYVSRIAMSKSTLALLIPLSLSLGFGSMALPVVVQSEPILISPASKNDLWTYSYQEFNPLITSASSFATETSHFSSAAFQGYLTTLNGTIPGHFVDSAGRSDYKTGHVMSTYVRSSIDQTITVAFGGDDGHSIFVDGEFQAGGGFGTDVTATIGLVKNVSRRIDWVCYNYTGPWWFPFGIWDGTAALWGIYRPGGEEIVGTLQSVPNLAINAENEFGPSAQLHPGFTRVVPDPGEATHAEILDCIYGQGFVQAGGSQGLGYENPRTGIVAMRVPDFLGGNSTTLGDPLDISGPSPLATDQIWQDGLVKASAAGRYASGSQILGYFPGETGGAFSPLLSISGRECRVTGETEMSFGVGETWRWGRDGSWGELWSSRASDNGGADHLVTYRVFNAPVHNAGLPVFVLFWEDLASVGGDFNDGVFELVVTGLLPNYTTFGEGCAGSAGTPSLVPSPGQLPRLGQEFTVTFASVPTGSYGVPFGMLGASNTEWGGANLPLDLSFMGMQGCTLYVSIDAPFQLMNEGGRASWTLPIPNMSSLIGMNFYQQGLVCDFATGDAIFTNAGEGTIGPR